MSGAYLLSGSKLTVIARVSESGIYKVVLTLIVLAVVIEQIHSLLSRLGIINNDYDLLEIKLPKINSNLVISNQKLFLIINNLLKSTSTGWLKSSRRATLELRMSNTDGINFRVFVPSALVDGFTDLFTKSFHGAGINQVKRDRTDQHYSVATFKTATSSSSDKAGEDYQVFSQIINHINAEDDLEVIYQAIVSPSNSDYLISKYIFSLLSVVLRSIRRYLFGDQTCRQSLTKNSGQKFNITLRLATSKDHNLTNNQSLSSVISSLSLTRNTLQVSSTSLGDEYLFKNYLPNILMFKEMALGLDDISSIFPIRNIYEIGESNIVESPLKDLPLPIKLRRRRNELVVGVNKFMSKQYKIMLTGSERLRHLLITGATGTGKSTVMANLIQQDIRDGHGLAVVDPHGDMVEELIRSIPKTRLKDVIYFNPRDISHPIGLNVLEVDPALTGDDLIIQRELITDSVISILRKLFDNGGVSATRLEHILRNAISTAFHTDNPTLFTVYRLLNNAVYRRKIVATLSDQRLKSFWFNEYEKAGDMQRVKLSFGVTSKLGRLLNSSVVRRSLAQPHSTIDFNEILNQNKILICNLSKGKIGEDNTDLIGSLILAKIQQAAYARQLLPTKMRKSFYVYVDEFQNFATKSFLQMLSESRKFGLALTIAEQTLSQQNEIGFNDTLLANVGSLICFRTSSPNDEKVLLPLFNNIEPSELLNLPSHHFIMRINAVDSFVPFSGQTVLAEPSKIDLSNEVISLSQKKYAYQG